MGRITKFKDYFRGPRDVVVFLAVLVWAFRIPAMLKKNNLEKLLEKITPRTTAPRGMTRRLVVYVNFWLNRNILTLKPTCLNRSLLLYRFLNRDGVKVRIHYGLRKKDDGHSWLTLDGAPFLQDGLTASEYRETFSYPPIKGDATA